MLPPAPSQVLTFRQAPSSTAHCHFPNLIFARVFVCCGSSCFKSVALCFKSMAFLILQEPRHRVDCVSSSHSSARGMKVHFKCTVMDINVHTYVYICIVERQDSLGTGDSGAVGLIPVCGTAFSCDHQYIFYLLVPQFPHCGR